jgi:hypothetical protein
VRTGWAPQRGNFSFYPTLFIASQEMFVNCEFRVPKRLRVETNSRRENSAVEQAKKTSIASIRIQFYRRK